MNCKQFRIRMNCEKANHAKKRLRALIVPIILAATTATPSTSFSAMDVATCSTLNTPGETYNLVNNLVGAPISAAPFADTACVKIAASGITLDCNGFNISNSGTSGDTVGIIFSSGFLTNITVKNCPGISGYTEGVFFGGSTNIITGTTAFNNVVGFLLGDATVTNSTAHNNSAGFSIFGNNAILSNNTAHDNFGPGFVVFSLNNMLTGNHAFNNLSGFSIASKNNTLDGNTANNNSRAGINIEAGADNNSLTNNSALNNGNGAVLNSFNNAVFNNVFCDNSTFDLIQSLGETGNVGDDNQCTKTSSWNDVGTTGCTFICDDAGPVTTEVMASPNPVAVNAAVTLTAVVSDADSGGSDIRSAEYSIDGSSFSLMQAQDGGFDSQTEDVTVDIGSFTAAGVYNVCVRGTDAAGNVGPKECIPLAVYDPSAGFAGFVTGGGWIDSPTGAYAADSSLTGKATFGFVSKYQKGATAPTGQTEFQFRVADLNFHSDTYQWLVVAGARAQYKGTGAINGTGSFGFLLTAIDGQLPGGGGLDKFRIKIWDTSTGMMVYDNQMGASDTADPTTVIGGGSIIVHKD